MSPLASVVIATHNQENRLHLVLAGLSAQTVSRQLYEIVVVLDGCDDNSHVRVQYWKSQGLVIRQVRLSKREGRCKARNVGASVARGECVMFLDGDALPDPGWLEVYLGTVDMRRHCALTGGLWCIPTLEFVDDPTSGELKADVVISSVVKRHLRDGSLDVRVSPEMVTGYFEKIRSRSVQGAYPFPGQDVLQKQIEELLLAWPDSGLAWVAFFPHNVTVPRSAFLEVGGFDEQIEFSEGWELGYRLMQADVGVVHVSEARTYHLYHDQEGRRSGGAGSQMARWHRAIEYMAKIHRDERFLLIPLWVSAILGDELTPEELRIPSLVDLHEIYVQPSAALLEDAAVVFRNHPRVNGVND